MRQLKPNRVKQMLSEGKPVIGTWLNLASVVVADNLGHLGFDFLVVDGEHSPIGQETMFQCLASIGASEAVAMARVAYNHPLPIKQALEAGAMGIVVPMVTSSAEADLAVSAMRFPPDGARSKGALSGAYESDYAERFNREVCAVVMVEDVEGVKHAEEILGVKGVDACFIGTGDLSLSMGNKVGDPDHEDAVQKVLKVGKDKGVPVGLPCATSEVLNRRVDQGFRFMDFSSDIRLLINAVQDGLAGVRR